MGEKGHRRAKRQRVARHEAVLQLSLGGRGGQLWKGSWSPSGCSRPTAAHGQSQHWRPQLGDCPWGAEVTCSMEGRRSPRSARKTCVPASCSLSGPVSLSAGKSHQPPRPAGAQEGRQCPHGLRLLSKLRQNPPAKLYAVFHVFFLQQVRAGFQKETINKEIRILWRDWQGQKQDKQFTASLFFTYLETK